MVKTRTLDPTPLLFAKSYKKMGPQPNPRSSPLIPFFCNGFSQVGGAGLVVARLLGAPLVACVYSIHPSKPCHIRTNQRAIRPFILHTTRCTYLPGMAPAPPLAAPPPWMSS